MSQGYYEIPQGCICVGDGLYGMKCEAATHAKWICRHERLNEDGVCRTCGTDQRGISGVHPETGAASSHKTVVEAKIDAGTSTEEGE